MNVLKGPSLPMLLTPLSWLELAARQAQGKEHGVPELAVNARGTHTTGLI